MATFLAKPTSSKTSHPKRGKTPGRDKAVRTKTGYEQDVDSFMKRIATGKDDEMEATERQLTGWYGKGPRPEPQEPKGAPNLQGSHPLRVR